MQGYRLRRSLRMVMVMLPSLPVAEPEKVRVNSVAEGARRMKKAEPQALEPSALVAVDSGFQVGGAVIIGRHLHVVGRAEYQGNFIGDQIISGRQANVLQIREHDVARGVNGGGEHAD